MCCLLTGQLDRIPSGLHALVAAQPAVRLGLPAQPWVNTVRPPALLVSPRGEHAECHQAMSCPQQVPCRRSLSGGPVVLHAHFLEGILVMGCSPALIVTAF